MEKILKPQDRCDWKVIELGYKSTENSNDHSKMGVIRITLRSTIDRSRQYTFTVAEFQSNLKEFYKDYYELIKLSEKTTVDDWKVCTRKQVLAIKEDDLDRFEDTNEVKDALVFHNAGVLCVHFDQPMNRVWANDTKNVAVAYANGNFVRKDVKKGEIVIDPMQGKPAEYGSTEVFLAYTSKDGDSLQGICATNYADALTNYRTIATSAVASADSTVNDDDAVDDDDMLSNHTLIYATLAHLS